jgi:ferredoxin-NADP reductase
MPAWKAGQAVTLDFAPELEMGWEHMNDEEPQSLNDDYIRTFTVSSPPPPVPAAAAATSEDGAAVPHGTEIQITVRRHGPATGLLWIVNPRAGLEVPVLGFGGDEKVLLPTRRTDVESVFVAGGVGITPLIAQGEGLLSTGNRLRLLWSLRGEDLPLAQDVVERIPGIAAGTKLFVTGRETPKQGDTLEKLKGLGVEISMGRMAREDVTTSPGGGRKYFVCAGDALMKTVLGWVEGEDVVFESFSY